MIDKLKSMAIFASIVDEGSFRGAAKKLGVSPAIVSLHIKKLEAQIGAPLLYRSTRRVTLTQDGEAFYESVNRMMSAAENGLNQFSAQASTQLTELRVAMPDTLSSDPIMTKITAFAKNHTGIRINLISTDRIQNLVKEGHDVAIRMGYFKDSDLKSKRIGEDNRMVVVAPSYAATKPKPTAPKELRGWDFIGFSIVPDFLELKQGEVTSQNVMGSVVAKANSALSVRSLCLAGLGAAMLPYHLIKRDLLMGRLVRVLPDWEDTKVLPIYLVWTPNADLSLATREFINFMS